MTHTYAILDVSRPVFEEIAAKLRAAGYHHAFDRDVIDLHGIAIRVDEQAQALAGMPPLGTPEFDIWWAGFSAGLLEARNQRIARGNAERPPSGTPPTKRHNAMPETP